ncbi:MAG: hypothetical protein JWQ40_2952 [Segetibacter sp.]|nr:hypothetical protein [Segetibacter sp.]
MSKLLLLLALIIFTSYIPRVASFKEMSVVTQVDTIENGLVRVYFTPITRRVPLKAGDIHVGDTIRGLILAKP